MEINEIVEQFINNDNDCGTNKKSVKKQKDTLKKQIEQLKSIILQTEWNLGISKFGGTNYIIKSQPIDTNTANIVNANTKFQSQLYKYSGFYCTKYTNNEFVFNFSSVNKYDKENTFAVQIVTNEGKFTLGKWKMPMSVDLNDLILEFPINDMNDVFYFLHICKHYIDCYFIRHKQFIALMDIVSQTKNAKLQANLGYSQINVELTGVHNTVNNKYMHLSIYLFYNANETKPRKVKAESRDTKKLNSKLMKHLKSSLSCFKKLDLHIAFEQIFTEEPFIWSKEADDDTPVDINNPESLHTDGFLNEFLSRKQASINLLKRKRKRKRNSLHVSKSTKSTMLHETEEQERVEQELESNKQHLQKNNDCDSAASTIIIHPKTLKQKTLKFHKNKSNLNVENNADSLEITSPKNKVVHREDNLPITSTPVRSQHKNPKLITSISAEVSDITANSESNFNIKYYKYAEKNQPGDNIPTKLLKKRIRTNVESLQMCNLK